MSRVIARYLSVSTEKDAACNLKLAHEQRDFAAQRVGVVVATGFGVEAHELELDRESVAMRQPVGLVFQFLSDLATIESVLRRATDRANTLLELSIVGRGRRRALALERVHDDLRPNESRDLRFVLDS